MHASEIRELLKLSTQPEVISFAGGLPSPEAFPVVDIVQVVSHVLFTDAEAALQYGTTEGYSKLREMIAFRMKKEGIEAGIENILITSGSQQGLDLVSKILIDPSDLVIVEAPSYLGGLGAMQAYRASFAPVKMDGNGLIPKALEETLQKAKKKPKLLYTVPTFQNPAGVTLTESRRKEVYNLACQHNLVILEDNPYGELRYSGKPVNPIKALDDENRVVYFGTFSKIFSPGIRLGWIVADEEFTRKLVIAKQATDLCTNSFVQRVVYEYCRRNLLDTHIEKIKEIYSLKRDTMLKAIEEYFPDGCIWTRPDGGLFVWASTPDYINTAEMAFEAIKQKVAYVPGRAFFVDGTGLNTMRLSFSHPPEEKITEGIRRLGGVIEDSME